MVWRLRDVEGTGRTTSNKGTSDHPTEGHAARVPDLSDKGASDHPIEGHVVCVRGREHHNNGSTPPYGHGASKAHRSRKCRDAVRRPRAPISDSTTLETPISDSTALERDNASTASSDQRIVRPLQNKDTDTPIKSKHAPNPGLSRERDWEARLTTDSDHATSAREARLRFERIEQGHRNAARLVRDRLAASAEQTNTSSATRKSVERNTRRLLAADTNDADIIGESPTKDDRSHGSDPFLSADASSFFPGPLVGPDDSFEPPGWFLESIQRICNHKTPTPSKSPIRFELSTEAADHNAELLHRFEYDLGKLIRTHEASTLGYGSEFRTVTELKPLLGRHPHFKSLANLITHGMGYVFSRELSEAERRKEVSTMLARGNHKSAQAEPEQVGNLIAKDVLHGFTIPIPVGIVSRIPGAMVQPLGMVKQWTVDANGVRVIKHRLTQDLSFSSDRTAPPTSINSRVDMTAYAEMIYGWCLPRILHYIVSLRIHNPGLLVLISKYDYSDAYRRIAHSAEAAAQTIAVNGTMAFLSLRLTFGGSPNPPTWCMFSELVTDLANEISQCSRWNSVSLRSPVQPETPEPVRLLASIPIAQGRRMAVLAPHSKRGGKVDGFIDDLINVFVDTPENCARQPHVVPLAMHITSRPHAGDNEEPVPRRPILSLPKLLAEGRPEEVQTVLGWRIDTRRLEISLPTDKYTAWTGDIAKIIADGHCSHKELETLVGRLNHTAYVLPIARHFLSRIREGLTPGGAKANRRKLHISKEATEDLALWEGFLANAHAGISMNLLVTRIPDSICWSDACPYGIGGYSLTGRAWRIRVPKLSALFGHKGVNNLLEFIGMAIFIWLACTEKGSADNCILAIGDNTSAIGWLHNTSHLDPTWTAHKAHLMVARKIASLLMEFKCCIASQHLKGELNVVADLLSFAGEGRGKRHPLAFDDPANDELTDRFLSTFPSQIPENFAISQLPEDVLSWTTQVLQVAESSLTADRKGATKSLTELGGGGKDTAIMLDTTTTTTSLCYPSTNGNYSCEHSSTFTASHTGKPMADLPEVVGNQWSQVLCAKPQATWLRRFGGISGKAPCSSRGRPTCAHSLDRGSRPATTGTRQNGNREQSHHNCSEQCS